MAFYINTNQQDCSREISVLLKKCILSYPHHWTDLVFLCIGTDRVTGDCLGPYVGHRLSSFCFPGIYVYGTLVQPVHALNLCDTRKEILSRHPDSLIIAVDASLGQKKHLGYVTIANGALYPGAAVHKKLPPVGHIHITGIVNTAGMLEQLTLQTTRLSTVISIAEQISNGILLMILNLILDKLFDLFVNTFCIQAIFLKKSNCRTRFSKYIINTDTFNRYRSFFRKAFAYSSA